ncbi:MAG: penicillin-binding transpeptidase domain-containing protein [Candidatus Omnitrophota bacterium]
MYLRKTTLRFKRVFIFFLALFILEGIYLFFIQAFRSNFLSNLARKQQNYYIEISPLRGTIFDINLRPQAINLPCDSLYANPRQLKDPKQTARLLNPILKIDEKNLEEKLRRKKGFVWLKRKISFDESVAIKDLNIQALGLVKESKRSYPNTYLMSHVLGFAGLDNQGLEGTELFYNQYLKGESGWAIILRDARQKQLPIYKRLEEAKDGLSLVLNLDEVIQYIAERELDKAYKRYHAKAASIIVMDPYTGRILALANRPTYDLNKSSGTISAMKKDYAVSSLFEPGSVFKIITASAALEEKVFSEKDRIFCENGNYKVGNHILHDVHPYGWLNFRDVIAKSSNIGVTKIAQKLGPQIIYKYAQAFGFGKPTGIDLPGEISGMLIPVSRWSKTSIGAIPIGHEVGVTVVQLASAISVIANGGFLVRPYIVSQIQDKEGKVLKKFEPICIRQVISQDTSKRMRDILSSVVEDGTAQLAKSKEAKLAGKTGTAQKTINGKYSHSNFFATFAGFAPFDNPKISIVVIVDDPHPEYYGGVVCAPVFKNVALDTLRYLKTQEVK